MIIAKHGNYILQHRTILGIEHLTTFQIEICKIHHNQSVYTICKLDKDTLNMISIDNRLLESIETFEDVESLKILTKILYSIYETEEIKL